MSGLEPRRCAPWLMIPHVQRCRLLANAPTAHRREMRRKKPMHGAGRPDHGRSDAVRSGRAGARAPKQDLRRCRQMHAKHADGPEPGMVVHGIDRSTNPGEPRRCGGPCPICVFCVHLPASALKPCLLRRAPHTAATDPGPCAPARTPCTNSGRLFGKTRQPGQATPHAPAGSCPTGAAHRLARSEMRRWRDSPGIGPADNSC